MKYHQSVLELIGNTPLVKLNRLDKGLKPLVLAKMENLNPGFSVKDRIGITMIQAAEEKGLLKKGGTIVEPTSGNTGTGLAIAACIMGYKCVFVMTDKVEMEVESEVECDDVEVLPTSLFEQVAEKYADIKERDRTLGPEAALALCQT